MEYGTASIPKREKQSELTEAHIKFQELGKRLDSCLMRLTTLCNKLSDESGNIAATNGSKDPSPHPPGLISDLNSDINGFNHLITTIEHQLSKLENNI